MSVFAKISDDLGTSTASAAIAEGRFLERSGADTVAQCNNAADVSVGVSACSAANGGDVRVYLPGQIAKVQAAADLNPATAAHCLITSDADGKAVAAAQGNRIMGLWLRQPGEDPGADDFITVLISDQLTIHP